MLLKELRVFALFRVAATGNGESGFHGRFVVVGMEGRGREDGLVKWSKRRLLHKAPSKWV